MACSNGILELTLANPITLEGEAVYRVSFVGNSSV